MALVLCWVEYVCVGLRMFCVLLRIVGFCSDVVCGLLDLWFCVDCIFVDWFADLMPLFGLL